MFPFIGHGFSTACCSMARGSVKFPFIGRGFCNVAAHWQSGLQCFLSVAWVSVMFFFFIGQGFCNVPFHWPQAV